MNLLMYGQEGVFLGLVHAGIFIQEYSGIFTVELADGRMDVTDDEHTVGQTVVLVTS